MSAPYWIIIPALNAWHYTEAAIADCLAQTGLPEPPQVLVIDTGSRLEVRRQLEAWTEREPRLHAWFHRPGLPSLSATWNLGLRFVWQQGGEVALVVNNDVRLDPWTYEVLVGVQKTTEALFVSAVGWDERRWMDSLFTKRQVSYWIHVSGEAYMNNLGIVPVGNRGGPDYSCFLLTKAGHEQYPFDEGFVPAYCEDCDNHRRYMLGGDGHRIFSVNLPYLHYGSGTVNDDPARLAEWARRIEQSRAYYARKWGGLVNGERFLRPFDEESATYGVTNPELQAAAAMPIPAPAEKESLSDA